MSDFCDFCGGAAYQDGAGAWRHVEIADSLFCSIFVAVKEVNQIADRHAAERIDQAARHQAELAEFDAAHPDAMKPLGNDNA